MCPGGSPNRQCSPTTSKAVDTVIRGVYRHPLDKHLRLAVVLQVFFVEPLPLELLGDGTRCNEQKSAVLATSQAGSC